MQVDLQGPIPKCALNDVELTKERPSRESRRAKRCLEVIGILRIYVIHLRLFFG